MGVLLLSEASLGGEYFFVGFVGASSSTRIFLLGFSSSGLKYDFCSGFSADFVERSGKDSGSK